MEQRELPSEYTATGETKPDSHIETESLLLQEAEWIREQAKQRRQIEEDNWELLQEQQKLLDEKYRSIEEDLNQTHQIRRHHEDCRDDMRTQVFALHGISVDKLQGLKEYGNARFQGIAAALLITSSALAVLCGFLYGATAQITLFMGFCVGVEGSLLSQAGRRWRVYEYLCRILCLLPLPAMAAVMVCMNFYPEQLELVMTICGACGLVFALIGVLPYFLYNPYRKERRSIHDAQSDLKELKLMASKAVRRNRRIREREERREERRNARRATRSRIREYWRDRYHSFTHKVKSLFKKDKSVWNGDPDAAVTPPEDVKQSEIVD